jgi:hypothetical protein
MDTKVTPGAEGESTFSSESSNVPEYLNHLKLKDPNIIHLQQNCTNMPSITGEPITQLTVYQAILLNVVWLWILQISFQLMLHTNMLYATGLMLVAYMVL